MQTSLTSRSSVIYRAVREPSRSLQHIETTFISIMIPFLLMTTLTLIVKMTIPIQADTLFDENFQHESASTAKHKSSCLSIDKLQDAAARWILKTSECHKVPQSVMDNIISDVRGLFDTGRFIFITS